MMSTSLFFAEWTIAARGYTVALTLTHAKGKRIFIFIGLSRCSNDLPIHPWILADKQYYYTCSTCHSMSNIKVGNDQSYNNRMTSYLGL